MDIAALSSLLGSLKTATDIARFIKDSDLSLEKAETKLKLAELISALADAKIEVAEIQQLLLERDANIRQLESDAATKAALIWREPCYWLANPDGIDEPYCQRCYDDAGKLARLHFESPGRYQCRVCDKWFSTQEQKQRDADAEPDYSRSAAQRSFGVRSCFLP